jgi:predicted class III extradiol MEMO1 family dioxygenase
VVDIIKDKADIIIEIIDGKKAAAIIASTDLHHLIKPSMVAEAQSSLFLTVN